MTTPVTPVTPGRPVFQLVAVSRLLLALAALFFILAALTDGGVFTGSGWNWLVPAGLASLTLALLFP
jgi:hypothetical protein